MEQDTQKKNISNRTNLQTIR